MCYELGIKLCKLQKFCHGKYNAVALLTIYISKCKVGVNSMIAYSRTASFLQKCQ